MKLYKIKHTHTHNDLHLHPHTNVTESADLDQKKRLWGLLTSFAQLKTAVFWWLMNMYDQICLSTEWMSKMRNRFLKNSEATGKTTNSSKEPSGILNVCAVSGVLHYLNQFPLSPSPTMTLHTNYFVPTAAKGGGRKWILLKHINRHSAHVFRSHQMFSGLDTLHRASAENSFHPATLTWTELEPSAVGVNMFKTHV